MMETTDIQEQINSINMKLEFIMEEMKHQQSARREMEDLKDDLMRVGTDVYQTAVSEFEEVQDSVHTGDFLYLGKKLFRNVNTITKAVDQLESIKDFLEDAAPLSRDSVIQFMAKLDELDQKGYFEFAKELGNILDNIVSSFTIEDVKHLSENVVTILNTIKSLTQPDMLSSVDNALQVYKKLNITVEKEYSLFGLMMELKKPEVKRGLAFGLEFIKNLPKQNGNN